MVPDVRDVRYYPLVGLDGRMVYVFKLSAGSLQGGWEAEEIAAKAHSALKGGDYAPHIVVMEGEPSENPKLFGSHPCVSYVQSILPTLANHVWHPAVLD